MQLEGDFCISKDHNNMPFMGADLYKWTLRQLVCIFLPMQKMMLHILQKNI